MSDGKSEALSTMRPQPYVEGSHAKAMAYLYAAVSNVESHRKNGEDRDLRDARKLLADATAEVGKLMSERGL